MKSDACVQFVTLTFENVVAKVVSALYNVFILYPYGTNTFIINYLVVRKYVYKYKYGAQTS